MVVLIVVVDDVDDDNEVEVNEGLFKNCKLHAEGGIDVGLGQVTPPFLLLLVMTSTMSESAGTYHSTSNGIPAVTFPEAMVEVRDCTSANGQDV